MPSRTYNVFISHSWAYGDAYEKIKSFLDNHPDFSYKDYSVPRNDPIHNASNDRELRDAIKRQMDSCHVVIVLAGVYASYSKWIQKEIDLAQNGYNYSKPILAIQPWGAEKTSQHVKDNANLIVGWNAETIVRAIKQLAS